MREVIIEKEHRERTENERDQRLSTASGQHPALVKCENAVLERNRRCAVKCDENRAFI